MAVIGVDIGGTKIKVGIVNEDGSVVHSTMLPTLAKDREVMKQTLFGIRTMLDYAWNERPDLKVEGIGIGSAGQIDFRTGVVISATDLLPDYAGTPIGSMVKEAFALPVLVDNDVNVLALSEFYGRSKDAAADHLICLALGTGVGGGLISDGRLIRGVRGLGGEVGHLCVDFRGSACNCGGRGCLELYASGTAIARRMREKWCASGAPGVLPEEFSACDVADLWFKEDPVASEVMSEAIQALASALAGLIHTFNPGKIVIGGGVADSGKPLFDRLRAETAIRTMPSFYDTVRIEPARFGSDSGMIGAAALFFTHRI